MNRQNIKRLNKDKRLRHYKQVIDSLPQKNTHRLRHLYLQKNKKLLCTGASKRHICKIVINVVKFVFWHVKRLQCKLCPRSFGRKRKMNSHFRLLPKENLHFGLNKVSSCSAQVGHAVSQPRPITMRTRSCQCNNSNKK